MKDQGNEHDTGMNLFFLTDPGDLSATLSSGGGLPDGFILGRCGSGSECGHMLRELRKGDETALLPVFLEDFPSDGDREAADGPARTKEEMENLAREIGNRLRDVDENALRKSLDLRLLAFLYSREGKKLRPVLDPLSRELYSYPLADHLSGGLLDSSRWISELLEKGYLEEESLADRIRACPKCGGAHLNYVDVCPFCRSMDIRQVPFIHCFTCGRVGPQEAFVREGPMQCPFCGARLRHIGSDYDRPMDNYLCSSCSQTFAEPDVSCRCFLCGAWSPADGLSVRSFREYSLSDKGVIAVRSGNTDDMYSVFDALNYTKPEPFRHILDWQLQLSGRPPVEPFSLMIISFLNVEKVKEKLGRKKVTEIMESLARRLRESIRKTDISTRTAENDLLLLLPKTGEKGCAVLASKVRELEKETLQPDGLVMEISVKTAVFPGDRVEGEDAVLLVARLKG
ncbi:MAG TPA: diguanylate cyclase [Aminivibrio sp.]|uniref:TackOD1 domain-containing metal-binding protein n=1 Tax=Aminivibrio sp. TaxID=1872489 RepID=UPI002CED8599|nr:diguanylate cyclase [Aminivibrio sp.]HPF86135.1 diguanylate cyclase [Aminivibrio sp.]